MNKRAAATAATRRRIVDATRELHATQGIAATSWDDIARRAGVGVGTVYRHFPSLDELIPACGRVAMEIVALPEPGAAHSLFDGLRGRRSRLERLVAEVFAIYDRGGDILEATQRERDVHPALAEDSRRMEESLGALIEAALDPIEKVADGDRRVIRAMLDLATWRALREQGIDGDEAVEVVTEIIDRRLAARRSR